MSSANVTAKECLAAQQRSSALIWLASPSTAPVYSLPFRLTCISACVQIIALSASYFVAVSALDITTNVGTIDDLRSTARILLVLPVAILDAVFILWVFTSLSRTLNQLQARKATSKLELYRRVH